MEITITIRTIDKLTVNGTPFTLIPAFGNNSVETTKQPNKKTSMFRILAPKLFFNLESFLASVFLDIILHWNLDKN